MNQLEMALQSWRQEKVNYEKSIRTVIDDLSRPVHLIPSPSHEVKTEQLKENLRYHYSYDEQYFNEVYVHRITGVINHTLMELANQISAELGGSLKYWQNKIIDIASNTTYHPQLTIWEVNKAFQKYMGISPEYSHQLRKKRSIAKTYLGQLASITKLIDKSKACQEDLLKLDDSYKKLKKVQQKYYAFIQEIEDEDLSKRTSNISLKGKNQAKSSLFMFLRHKEEKQNTLASYNFVFRKEVSESTSKLLKGKEYQQLDDVFALLVKASRSQRQSSVSQWSQGSCRLEKDQNEPPTMAQLRQQFTFCKDQKKDQSQEEYYTFIWRPEYYFTYWGFPVRYTQPVDFLDPFHLYSNINYEIDSEDEFDQLDAEDLGSDDNSSEQSSISQTSFVVDDDYFSDQQKDKERDIVYVHHPNPGHERWIKQEDQLTQYEPLYLCSEESFPLVTDDSMSQFQDQFIDRIEGKGRTEIIGLFEAQRKDFSKSRVEELLRRHYRKVKTKQNKTIYVRPKQKDEKEDVPNQPQIFSDQDTTYEISITRPSLPITRSRSKILENQPTKTSKSFSNNDTILQQPSSIRKK